MDDKTETNGASQERQAGVYFFVPKPKWKSRLKLDKGVL
jgi:hypothetical protein